ncbi:hypothetical protein V6N13_056884 [Hibiscus sabdariffa]
MEAPHSQRPIYANGNGGLSLRCPNGRGILVAQSYNVTTSDDFDATSKDVTFGSNLDRWINLDPTATHTSRTGGPDDPLVHIRSNMWHGRFNT